MRPIAIVLMAGLVGAAALAACGDDDDDGGTPETAGAPATAEEGVIEVVAIDLAFEPSVIEVSEGETVTIRLVNEGQLLHDFTSDDMPAMVEQSTGDAHDMEGEGEPGVHVAADAGQTGELTFTATDEGEFEFYCSVPGHRESGMVGTIRVVS